MYGRVLEDAMRHTTSGTVSVLEYLTGYAKDSISLIETCFYINVKSRQEWVYRPPSVKRCV